MGAARRHIVVLSILALVSVVLGSASEAGEGRSPSPGLTVGLEELIDPDVVAPTLPPDAERALLAAAVSFAPRLGLAPDAGRALADAHLDGALAGRLALLLADLGTCHDATTRLLRDLPGPVSSYLVDDAEPVSIPEAAAIRACAGRVQSRGLELSRFLAATPADMGSDLALWPVLRLDLDGSDDVIRHDYVLSVDRAGNDVYLNSAGGNPLDLQRGPTGSLAPKKEPSRGCVNPGYDLAEGQCVLSAALLVDVTGDDTYGQMEAPDVDTLCTDEPLVRRVLTEGAGFAGAGVLIEGSGNDRYLGKVVTQGAGHIGGVGILRDEAGDDVYTAMRLSKGFGTIVGLGLLRDISGNDRYDYYMPRAIDPGAPYKTPGSGGGLSATGLCDNQPRWDEGTGAAGGIGILVEDGGDDTYIAGAPLDHLFGTTDPLRRTGSQGFGDFQGFGYMHDHGGRDSYSGMPDRRDDTTVMPTPQVSGLFVDGSGGGLSVRAAGSGGSALVLAHAGHFMPKSVTIDQGTSLQFLNADSLSNLEFIGHTLTEVRSDGGPVRFGSDLVPFPEAREVDGVPALTTGRYDFRCEVHPFMRGVLTVR
ncbi:MAG: cupredoxin domain-containing protein [Acidimicrobiia bacterium]